MPEEMVINHDGYPSSIEKEHLMGIPGYWYAIFKSSDVKKKPVRLKRFGKNLVLWRDSKGNIACLPDSCLHRGARLSQGKICGDRLVCPYHGINYDTAGNCVDVPFLECQPTEKLSIGHYQVVDKNGLIWFWYDDVPAHLQAPADQTKIPLFSEDGLIYSSHCAMEWHAHYTRMVQGFIDMHHFCYLHRKHDFNTGGKVLAYKAEMRDGTIYQDITMGDKQDPSKRTWTFNVEYKFPAAQRVYMTKTLTLVGYFAPIDEDNTWYCWSYGFNSFLPKILNRLIAWYTTFFYDRYSFQSDDKRVVPHATPHFINTTNQVYFEPDGALKLWYEYRQSLLKNK